MGLRVVEPSSRLPNERLLRQRYAGYDWIRLVGPGFSLLLALSCSQSGDPVSSRTCSGCNVILVLVDTLRADHLSLYGYKRQTSPNIDRFAEDAITFDAA
jgi:hypothetical protein